MIDTLKSLTYRWGNKPLRGSSLHEDWRLVSLVLIFSVGILLQLQELIPKASSHTLGLIFSFLGLASLPQKPTARLWFFATAALVLGAACAQFKLEKIHPQSLERETFVQLSGVVRSVEHRPEKPTRLTLDIHGINKETWLIGQKVRLTVRTEMPEQLYAGWLISLNAVLSSPSGAIVPGGFDFGSYNRIQGIVAQGFATSSVEVNESGQRSDKFLDYVENTRSQLAAKILNNIEQPLGGVAVALVTGQRQHIKPVTANNIRDAGLAHLLAISGLHMGLVTGSAFLIFELIFAGIGGIALRITPRKASAVFAWLFAVVYLVLSGGSTSTIRAFVMVTVAILALLTDRRVLSLRSIAIAAFIILLFNPHAILGAGFQMSFAATIGIVLAYDYLALRRDGKPDQNSVHQRPSIIRKVLLYFIAAAGTSFIAQLAVGPIALYHFQTFSLVGIFANIVAIPLMAFVVMPSAFLAIAFSTLGLEAPFLFIMEGGLYLVVEIATILAASPMSVIATTPFGIGLLISAAITFALLMIWRGALPLAIAVMALVVALAFDSKRPADVLIAGSGTIIAERGVGSNPSIIGGRRDGFRDDAWKRYWGHRHISSFQKLDRLCDSRGCKLRVTLSAGDLVESMVPMVVSKSLETTRKACNEGSIVIASYTHRRYCRGAIKFLSVQDIERFGPVGLWGEKSNENKLMITHQWSNPPKKDK